MPVERVSPRQSIVVLPPTMAEFAGAPLAAYLDSRAHVACLSAALLDVVGALVRVDGVTLAVLASRDAADQAVLAELPAGIDLIDPGQVLAPGLPAQVLPAVLRALLDREFERVVAVAGDVVGLTPRIAATALSALGVADLVTGPSPSAAGYLVGVRNQRGVEALASAMGGSFGGSAFPDRAKGRDLVVRRVDPRTRLTELHDLPTLAAAVELDPKHSPRMARFLSDLRSAAGGSEP